MAMKDWQVAVMVVMCVVFVVLATVLVFLIYRYWNGEARSARFWCCGDDDDEANLKQTGSAATTSEAGGCRSIAYYPGCRPNPNILYFLDFNQVLRSINIKRDRINTGAQLQQALGHAAGVTDSIDTLSLAATYASSGVTHMGASSGNQSSGQVDDVVGAAYLVGDATVEVDLDRLLAKDPQRAQRMKQTAERPLLLHRLVEVTLDGTGAGAVATSQENLRQQQQPLNSAPTNPLGAGSHYAPHGQHANNIDVSIARQRQWPHDGYASPQWAATNAQQSPASHSGAPVPSYLAGIFADPASPAALPAVTSAPTPLIFPSNTSHITASTPVFIMAAHYFICSPQSCAFNPQPPRLVDEATTAQLEAAMCGESSSRTLLVTHGPLAGSTFVVDPRKGTALLRSSALWVEGGLGAQELVVVRRKADIVRYCVDTTGSPQWRSFERPIFLPPGRWCLRAKVSSADEAYSATAAKVFSVSVSVV